MSGRNEQEYLLQEMARRELAQGRIDRREFITRSLVTGLGLAGVGAAAKSGVRPAFAADRPLTPTFYQWIQDLHPGIPAVNAKFPGINYQIAPVEGFGIERFVAEAKNRQSTWDVYVGQTPFVEMSPFIKAGVIEPWDNYIPKDVIDDIIPSIREECTVDGKLYSWPFLLDVIGSAWHSGITTQGRRCPTLRPRPGTSSSQARRRSLIRRPRRGARRSTRTAGVRSCRSPTA